MQGLELKTLPNFMILPRVRTLEAPPLHSGHCWTSRQQLRRR